VLDLDDLRNRCRNKNTLMVSILIKFQEVAKQHVADCRVAVNASDPPRAATASHTLKGAAANIGAKVIAAAAGDLEHAAKAADLEGMKLSQPRLEAAVQELLSLIPGTLKDLGAAPVTEAAR
jgi:two-component system sensor histidine kinase/response regulator